MKLVLGLLTCVVVVVVVLLFYSNASAASAAAEAAAVVHPKTRFGCVVNENCADDERCIYLQHDVVDRGIRLKKGMTACVPRDVDTRKRCDKGVLMKTDNDEWSCHCKWPHFFGGKHCDLDQICEVNGSRGKLLNLKTKEEWDRNDDPYARTADGKPKYACMCPHPYITKPGDPYSCAIDGCSHNGRKRLWNGEKCDCRRAGLVESNVTGKCIRPPCDWDYSKNACKCYGQSRMKLCNSPGSMSRGANEPDCEEGNLVGSKCIKPCKGYCSLGTGAIVNDECRCSCLTAEHPGYSIRGRRCDMACLTHLAEPIKKAHKHLCCNGSDPSSKMGYVVCL